MIEFMKNLFKKEKKNKTDTKLTVEEFEDGCFIKGEGELTEEEIADIVRNSIIKILRKNRDE